MLALLAGDCGAWRGGAREASRKARCQRLVSVGALSARDSAWKHTAKPAVRMMWHRPEIPATAALKQASWPVTCRVLLTVCISTVQPIPTFQAT